MDMTKVSKKILKKAYAKAMPSYPRLSMRGETPESLRASIASWIDPPAAFINGNPIDVSDVAMELWVREYQNPRKN